MAEIEVLIEVLAAALKLTLEGISVVTIAVGVIFAAVRGIRSERVFAKVRLTLSRFLVLALELQLAADVVGSAIAPTWEQIGRLAAIAAIRTFLNYFLVREMKNEEAERAAQ